MLDVSLAPSQHALGLTVFPLVSPGAEVLPYPLLHEAIAAGVLEITEVGSGTVPTLLAISQASSAVLVLDGEQLVGARQNRTTNRSILLPAHSKTEIPVSCMEQGRWHHVSPDFKSAPQASPTSVRRHARDAEAAYAGAGDAFAPQMLSEVQGAVWSTIREHADEQGIGSATGALNELYDQRTVDLEAALAALPALPGQVGLLAFVRGAPLGLDLLGDPILFGKLHQRLLRGYLWDALGHQSAGAAVKPAAAQRFLDQVREAARVAAPTVGQGRYSVLHGTVVGGELVDGEHAVHLSAFPARDGSPRGGSQRESPLAPPSQRRRQR